MFGSAIAFCLALTTGFVPMAPSFIRPQHFILLRGYLTEILLALTAGIALLGWATGRLRFRICPGWLLLAAFFLVNLASVPTTVDKPAAIYSMRLYFAWVALAFLGFNFLRGARAQTLFLSWFAAGAVPIGLYGLWEYLTTPFEQIQIVTSFAFPTLYAGFLTPSVFMLQGGFFLAERPLEKGVMAVATALLTVNVFLCKSLMGIVCLLLGEFVFLTLWFKHWEAGLKTKRSATAFLVVSLTIAIAGRWAMLEKPDSRRYVRTKVKSVEIRLLQWKATRDMIAQRPMIGFGAGQYPVRFPSFRSNSGVAPISWEEYIDIEIPCIPENLFLALMAESGSVGLTIFGGIIAYTGFAFWKSQKRQAGDKTAAACLVSGLAASVAYALFHFPFHTPGVWPAIWISAAMLWAMTDSTRAIIQAPEGPPAPTVEYKGRKWIAATAALAALIFWIYLAIGSWILDMRSNIAKKEVLKGNQSIFTHSLIDSHALAPWGPNWTNLVHFGDAFLYLGSYEEAHETYLKAARLRPNSLLLLKKLAQTERLLPNPDSKLTERYERAIKKLENNASSN